MTTRRKYDEKTKLEAVKTLRGRGSRTVSEVADELGIPKNLLWKWNKQVRAGSRNGVPKVNGEPAVKRRLEPSPLRDLIGRALLGKGEFKDTHESLMRVQLATLAVKEALDGIPGLSVVERRGVLMSLATYEMMGEFAQKAGLPE